MKTFVIALVAAIPFPRVGAADNPLKLESLAHYKNVTVTRVDPDGIRITHDSGATKVPFEKLPEDLRNQLGLNLEKALVHREQASHARAKAIEREAIKLALDENRYAFVGTIFQVVETGVLLENTHFTDGSTMEIEVPRTVVIDGPSTLSPHRRLLTRTSYETESVPKTVVLAIVFVECDTTNLADGDIFASEFFADGTYFYVDALGIKRTVPAFTTDAGKIARSFQGPSAPEHPSSQGGASDDS